MFPLEIRFGRPSKSDDWHNLQREITSLAQGQLGYQIEWTDVNTRRWGRQRFPERVWFATETEFLRAIHKQAEVEGFRKNVAYTRQQCAELESWLTPNALCMLEFAGEWPDIIEVCRYFMAHSRPGLYVRELPIPVDTKFIERHQGVLRRLLDFLLPSDARSDAEGFEERFGLRYDEPLIRVRLLDQCLRTSLCVPASDISIPLSQFRALNWLPRTAIIVENKMTFLTLPPVVTGIGIWGGGGAAELLTSVTWLRNCRLIYWGDVDVHGFHILSRLRRKFTHVVSVMMDCETLDAFPGQIARARPANYEDQLNLTTNERTAYVRVKARGDLLEQERIGHGYIIAQLKAAIL